MKRMSFAFVAAALLAAGLALAACETATPYQPRDASGYGFSDQRLENNRYRISFRGNAATDRSQVENSMLYRAAELTLANNYDYFIVVDRGTDKRSTVYSDYPGYPGPFFHGRYYSPRWGWRGFYDPFWDDPINYHEITRYEADGEIVMYKGQKPAGDAKAFDARQVQQNLQGKVLMPAPPKA